MLRPTVAAYLCISCSYAVAQFGAPIPIDTASGHTPRYALPSDVDLDGDIDIVSLGAEWNSTQVLLHENLGGVFAPPVLQTTTIGRPNGAGWIDLDADGDQDLVYIITSTYNLEALYNNAGSFAGPAVTLAPSFADRLRFADMDADGDTDVVGSYSVSLRWRSNLGNGNFNLYGQIAIPINGGLIAVADSDGDGAAEVIYDGTWLAKNDGYGSTYTYSGVHAIWAQGWEPGYWDIADFSDIDLDGRADILLVGDLFADAQRGYVAYSMNTLPNGTTFSTPSVVGDYPKRASTEFDHVELMEVTGDTNPDIVVLSSSIWVFKGTPGGFASTPTFLAEHPNCSNTSTVECADVTGDGAPDLIVASAGTGGLVFIPGDGLGGWTQPQQLIDELTRPQASTADLNNDGHLDVIVNSDYSGYVSWYPGDGLGNFGARQNIYRAIDHVKEVLPADVDQDGDVDLFSRSDTVCLVHINNGGGVFAPSILVGDEGWMNTADIDQDGDLDLITDAYLDSVRWHENLGGGIAWSAPNTIGASSPFPGSFVRDETCMSTDLDMDGDPDVLVAISDSVGWYQNSGNGQFAPWALLFEDTIPSNERIRAMLLVDLDGDLQNDMVIGGGNTWRIFWRDGSAFVSPTTIGVPLYSSQNRLSSADVNGDGLADLTAICAGGRVAWSENYGARHFGPFIQILPLVSGGELVGEFGDVNGDGAPDLVLGRYSSWDDLVAWAPNLVNSPFSAQGRVYHDANANGVADPGEPGFPTIPLQVQPAVSQPYTDTNGDYVFSLLAGDYTVAPMPLDTSWHVSSDSASYTFTLDALEPIADSLDFGISVTGSALWMTPSIHMYQGHCNGPTNLHMSVYNYGPYITDLVVRLDIDTLLTPVSFDYVPDSVVGIAHYWSVDELPLLGHWPSQIEVVMPDAGAIGEFLDLDLTVWAYDTSGVALDTLHDAWSQEVTCSYDPNDKVVQPPGFGTYHAIDIDTEELIYTIRFQNTGNDTATTVRLEDELDLALDVTSLWLLDYSHPCQVIVMGDRTLIVTFPNIQLPDSATDPFGSQGFVRFRIDIVPGQPHACTIENTASIFFDLNPAIVTNTTLSTLVDCNLHSAQITLLGTDVLQANTGIAYQWYLNGVELGGATSQELVVDTIGEYSVEVTSEFGCVALSDGLLANSVHEMSNAGSGIRVIPDPVLDQALVHFTKALSPDDRVHLLDAHGRTVRVWAGTAGNTLLLERGHLPPGLYVLQVTGPQRVAEVIRLALQ